MCVPNALFYKFQPANMRKNDVMRWAFLALTTHRLLIENTQIKKAMRSRFFLSQPLQIMCNVLENC